MLFYFYWETVKRIEFVYLFTIKVKTLVSFSLLAVLLFTFHESRYFTFLPFLLSVFLLFCFSWVRIFYFYLFTIYCFTLLCFCYFVFVHFYYQI